MHYPEDMTADDIMEFEFEINRVIDMDRGEGQFWAVNAELQLVSDEIREALTVDRVFV